MYGSSDTESGKEDDEEEEKIRRARGRGGGGSANDDDDSEDEEDSFSAAAAGAASLARGDLHLNMQKQKVCGEVLKKLSEAGCEQVRLPGFADELKAHFMRLPSRFSPSHPLTISISISLSLSPG